jgi:hypothetical protein
LDSDRGEIVGLVKARHGPELGLVIPLDELHGVGPEHKVSGAPDLGSEPWNELLRRHDLWHLQQQDRPGRSAATWTDMRRRLPGHNGSWNPVDRLEELGWLARVAPPARPGVVGRVIPSLGERHPEDWPRPLRSWRDGYAQLSDREVDHLNFLTRVVQEVEVVERATGGVVSTTRDMAEWVRMRRRELDPEELVAVPAMYRLPQAVLVEVEPLIGYGEESRQDTYRWSISSGYGAGEWLSALVGDDWAPLTLSDALGQVRDVLGEVLAGADGAAFPVRLEIAIPIERMLPLAHNWRTSQGLQGGQREVVLRHSARRGRPDRSWANQWDRIGATKRLRARPVVELSDLDAVAEEEVPVLCRHGDQLGTSMARRLLDRGHAVALWRGTNGQHAACSDSCVTFRDRVSHWLAGHGAQELPEKLKDLRKQAHERRGQEDDWVRDLVMLYDDPRNPLP